MNTTTRIFPRTSQRQSDASYGAAIERTAPRSPTAYKAIAWALFAGGVAVIISVFFQGAP